MRTPSGVGRPLCLAQAQQRVCQPLAHALGCELADPSQRIGHVRRHLAHDVGPDLRIPLEQAARVSRAARHAAGRLHRERGDRIGRAVERDDAAKWLAGTHEADDQLGAVHRHLDQLQQTALHQVEALRRLSLPRQRPASLQESKRGRLKLRAPVGV